MLATLNLVESSGIFLLFNDLHEKEWITQVKVTKSYVACSIRNYLIPSQLEKSTE